MKVLVADDHPLVRSGLKGALADLDSDMEVFEAVDFPQVMEVVAAHSDLTLVLLDLNMPGSARFSGLKTLRDEYPALPVVILSGSEDPRDVRGALDNGAAGYIPKSSPTSVMLSALNLVLSGGVYVPTAVLANGSFSDSEDGSIIGAGRSAFVSDLSHSLTGRQLEVLDLMRKGKSNKEIARDLDIAESTVKAHVSVILKTLGVSSRAKAILAADAVEN